MLPACIGYALHNSHGSATYVLCKLSRCDAPILPSKVANTTILRVCRSGGEVVPLPSSQITAATPTRRPPSGLNSQPLPPAPLSSLQRWQRGPSHPASTDAACRTGTLSAPRALAQAGHEATLIRWCCPRSCTACGRDDVHKCIGKARMPAMCCPFGQLNSTADHRNERITKLLRRAARCANSTDVNCMIGPSKGE